MQAQFSDYFELLRAKHWYKNLILYFGLWYGLFVFKQDLDRTIFIESFLVFLLASLMSSSNYIINQITDSEFDKRHPVKKYRPLPSGRVFKLHAFYLSLAMAGFVFVLSSLFFSFEFNLALLFLWIAGFLYNVKPIRLKDIPYVDVLSESVNNPIRFLLGWFLIQKIFPSFIILFLAWVAGAVLMTLKRYWEMRNYAGRLDIYRKTFSVYTKTSLLMMVFVYSLVCVIFLYLTYLKF